MVSDEDHRDRTTPGDGSTQLSPRRRTLVGVGVLVLVVAATATFLVMRESGTATDARTCNGAEALCDLTLDEVALATTHNSMNDAEDGFPYPSQERGIEAQLEAGVRGFLIDAFLGSVRQADDEQIVYTELTDRRLTRLVKAVGNEPAQHALRLRAASRPTGRGCAPRRLPLPRVLRARRGPVQRRGRRTSPFPRRAPGRGGGRRHPGRARGRRAHSGARGGWSRPLPRHHRPECPATHARVDGGVGAPARDRSRER